MRCSLVLHCVEAFTGPSFLTPSRGSLFLLRREAEPDGVQYRLPPFRQYGCLAVQDAAHAFRREARSGGKLLLLRACPIELLCDGVDDALVSHSPTLHHLDATSQGGVGWGRKEVNQ